MRLLALEALKRESHFFKLVLEHILQEFCDALGGGLLVDYKILHVVTEPWLKNTQLAYEGLISATYEQNGMLWVPLAV